MPTPITTISISHQKVDIEADYKTLIVGINAELATVDPLVIGGKSILRADLVARFQARIEAADGVKSARGLLQSAIAHERSVDAEVPMLRAATKVYEAGSRCSCVLSYPVCFESSDTAVNAYRARSG